MRVGLLRSLSCLVQSDVQNDLWNWLMIPFGKSPSSPHIVPRFCSWFILCHWPIIYQAVCASSVCLLKGLSSEFYYKNSQIFNWYICALTYQAPCYTLQISRRWVSDELTDPWAEGSILGLIGCLWWMWLSTSTELWNIIALNPLLQKQITKWINSSEENNSYSLIFHHFIMPSIEMAKVLKTNL